MAHTVCVAGICRQTDRRECAIICSDARIELEGIASGEVPWKARHLSRDCVVMFAGSVPKATCLAQRYIARLSDAAQEGINNLNTYDVLRGPLAEQRRADVTDYLSATRGMTYSEFLQCPEHERQSILVGFPAWNTSCELILVYFGGDLPRLFVVSERVHEELAFATIGVGWTAAHASLMARKYNRMLELVEATYYIYEAKRNSEIVPGVGDEKTYMAILEFDAGSKQVLMHHLDGDTVGMLVKGYARFGPKPFSRKALGASTDIEALFHYPRRLTWR